MKQFLFFVAASLLFSLSAAQNTHAFTLVSQDLNESSYYASSYYTDKSGFDYLPSHAFDGFLSTQWNSGSYSSSHFLDSTDEWIEVNLQGSYIISEVYLTVEQYPPGETTHNIYCSNSIIGDAKEGAVLMATLNGETKNGDFLPVAFDPYNSQSYQYVQIETVSSPSWVAWKNIEIFADESLSPSPVPEPSTLLLLGSGLIIFAKRKKRVT